jgi:hypothetical protein
MESPNPLFLQFQKLCKRKLLELADKIMIFSPIKKKYLYEAAMREDIATYLYNYLFTDKYKEEEFDWDTLTEEDMKDIKELNYNISRDMFFDIIMGIKEKEIGIGGTSFIISPSTGEIQIGKICKLIDETFLEMIKDYSKLVKSK